MAHKDNVEKLLEIKKYKFASKYDNSKEDDLTHDYKTKVICITTGKIFDSVLDGARYYNIKSENGICYCCSYKRKTCGGLSWMYLDEYEYMVKNNLTIEDMKNRYKPKNVTKKVVCLDNKKIFNSIVEANKYASLSVYSGKISEACKNKKYCAGKDKDGNNLHWMYYEDFINLKDNEIEKICNTIKDNRIVCLETKHIFDSINDAQKYAGLKSNTGIYQSCKNKKRYSGKHPITGEPLHWMYIKDYIKEFGEVVKTT